MQITPEGSGRSEGPQPEPPDLPGYRCERLLGRGGSSCVWLIRDPSGQPFALKVLDPVAGVHRDVAAARREELLLERFQHEHLVAVHEVLDTNQGAALRMEYAAGGSLAHLVSVRGPLPPGEVVTVLVPIAQALAYLHAGGAVHGDVSPANVLLTELGKPLLSDLGISALLGESDPGGGTPGFRDSHVSGESLNTAADLYALAALGWFALTGRVPGPVNQRPPLSLLVPEAPESLTELILWGLNGDPAARPRASDYARSLQRALPAVPVDLVAAVHPEVLPLLRTQSPGASKGAVSPASGSRRELSRAQTRRSQGRVAPGRQSRRSPGQTLGVAVAAAGGLAALTWGLLVMSGAMGSGQAPSADDPAQSPVEVPTELRTESQTERPTERPTETPAEIPTKTQTEPQTETLDDGVDQQTLTATDPLVVLPYLAKVREQALETADAQLLGLVNVPGSAAMAADQQLVRELVARGHVLSGLTIGLTALTTAALPDGVPAVPGAEAPDPEVVAISATATTSGYSETSASGQARLTKETPVTQELTFVLQLTDDRWRISAVYGS